jgi:predicted phosphodiesterase
MKYIAFLFCLSLSVLHGCAVLHGQGDHATTIEKDASGPDGLQVADTHAANPDHPVIAMDGTPPWQQPSAWPDRIIVTLAGEPATSFSVNWRTEPGVTATAAEIAPATAQTRFDLAAKRVPAVSERFEYDPAWLEGQGNTDTSHWLIDPVAYHSVTFDGLEPGTLYAYRVQGAGGNWSAWRQVRTAPAGGPVEFLYFGDAQNGIRSHVSRMFETAAVVAPTANFMLHAGDLVNKGLDDRLWAEWFAAGGDLFQRMPSIPVPGNHDKGAGNRDVLTPFWRPQFVLPVEPGLPEVLSEAAYAIRYTPDLHLFAINSSALEFQQQLDWLAAQLKASKAKWRIVYMHHPFFSWVGDGIEKPDQTVKRAQLDAFLAENDIDLLLTGHRHSYQRAESGAGVHSRDKHAPYEVDTVFLVTAMTIKRGFTKADGWERFSREREGNISLTRYGDDIPLFGIFRIEANTLAFRAVDAVGATYDAFSISKDAQGRKTLTNGAAAFGPVVKLERASAEY